MDSERAPEPAAHRPLTQLDEGIALAHAGDKAGARAIFTRIIHNVPEDEDAWLWLAWTAENQAQGLSYLDEARILLPDSTRIAEALYWARQEAERTAGTTPAAHDGRVQARPHTGIKPVSRKIAEAARAMQQGANQALHGMRDTADRVHGPRFVVPDRQDLRDWWQRIYALRRIATLVCYSLAAGLITLLIMLSILNARNGVLQAVEIPELPTPALDATATPTIKQQLEPLWVQVDLAFTKRDWETAIDVLERIRTMDPDHADALKGLAEARYGRALNLVGMNKLEEANTELEQVIRLDGSYEEAQNVRRVIKAYLTGVEAYWANDWPRVIENLEQVYAANAQFRDTPAMLARAHYEIGLARQEKKLWLDALASFETALRLLPGMAVAETHMAEVRKIIVPPKRIEVEISKQRLTLYEDDKPVKTYVVCTGREGAPTLPGRYEVQSKIPLAYASKWNIDMPNWLGIYWAGGTENGFHGLPKLKNGRTIWQDRLGQPCSYGCIVLGSRESEELYNWAEIGTVALVKP